LGKVFQALNKAQSSETDTDGVQDSQIHENSEATTGRLDVPGETTFDSTAIDGTILGSANSDDEKEAFGSPADWDEKISALFDMSSGLGENIKRLRSEIVYPPTGASLRKILVTSMEPGEGKSFISAALGISIAQGLEEHALLVDCDLRRANLASLFNVKCRQGLVDHLVNEIDLGQLIIKTGMRKLSLIPSGSVPVNPAELLCSDKVGRMFAELNERYDDRYTIIDTAPFGIASETAVLAKHVDGIVLVVRWGRSSRDQVKKMVETLGREKIIGVVFNAYETNMLSSKVSGYYDYGPVDSYKYGEPEK